MEIVINVVKSPSGRLAGTMHAPGDGSAVDFSGTTELLAALERLCTPDDRAEQL
jgi:hypothetical protein